MAAAEFNIITATVLLCKVLLQVRTLESHADLWVCQNAITHKRYRTHIKMYCTKVPKYCPHCSTIQLPSVRICGACTGTTAPLQLHWSMGKVRTTLATSAQHVAAGDCKICCAMCWTVHWWPCGHELRKFASMYVCMYACVLPATLIVRCTVHV